MDNKKVIFYKICDFTLNNVRFTKFSSPLFGDAYLKNIDDKYYYPTSEEFALLIDTLYNEERKSIFAIDFNTKKNHMKYKFLPKLKHNGKTVVLTSALLFTILTGCGVSPENQAVYSTPVSSHTSTISVASNSTRYDASEDYDSATLASIPYDVRSDGLKVWCYNSEKFDDIFGCKENTLEDLYSAVDSNSAISDEYKEFIKNYFKELKDYYPDLDLRVFVYNLKTLNFQFLSPSEIDLKQSGGFAYWDSSKNTIVLPDNLDYKNDMLSLIALRHELGHLGNTFKIEVDGVTYTFSFESKYNGGNVKEALNTILTTNPYMDYYESNGVTNLGYPLITNELRVILDCIDYDIQDSLTSNVYTLENQMNLAMTDEDMDSHVALGIIDMQQQEVHNESIEVDENQYVDLYTYIAKLYINKYVTDEMSYDDVKAINDELNNRLLTGLTHTEYVYTDTINSVFDSYCLEHGLSGSITR